MPTPLDAAIATLEHPAASHQDAMTECLLDEALLAHSQHLQRKGSPQELADEAADDWLNHPLALPVGLVALVLAVGANFLPFTSPWVH